MPAYASAGESVIDGSTGLAASVAVTGRRIILAVPMLVIIKSVADYVESLRSLWRLMAS